MLPTLPLPSHGPRHPQSHPPDPCSPPSPVHPHPRTAGCSSSPSTGRDVPHPRSRTKLGLQAMGKGGCQPGCTRASLPCPWAGDGQPAGSGPVGLPAQNPGSGFGELSTDSCYGTSPGERIWFFFSWGMGLKEMPGAHGKVSRFLKGFLEPHFWGVWSLPGLASRSISVHVPSGRDLEVTGR